MLFWLIAVKTKLSPTPGSAELALHVNVFSPGVGSCRDARWSVRHAGNKNEQIRHFSCIYAPPSLIKNTCHSNYVSFAAVIKVILVKINKISWISVCASHIFIINVSRNELNICLYSRLSKINSLHALIEHLFPFYLIKIHYKYLL